MRRAILTTLLAAGAATFVAAQGGAARPQPSPDGKYLAFVRRVRNQSTLFLKDLATGRETAAWSGLA